MAENIAISGTRSGGAPNFTGVGRVDVSKPRIKLDALQKQLSKFNDQALARVEADATDKAKRDGVNAQTAKRQQEKAISQETGEEFTFDEMRLAERDEKIRFGRKYAKAYNEAAKVTFGAQVETEYRNQAIKRMLDGDRSEVDPATYVEGLEDDFDTAIDVMNKLDPSGALTARTTPQLRAAADTFMLDSTRRHVAHKLELDAAVKEKVYNDIEKAYADDLLKPGTTVAQFEEKVTALHEHLLAQAKAGIGAASLARTTRAATDRMAKNFTNGRMAELTAGGTANVQGVTDFVKGMRAGKYFDFNKFPDLEDKIGGLIDGYRDTVFVDFDRYMKERSLGNKAPLASTTDPNGERFRLTHRYFKNNFEALKSTYEQSGDHEAAAELQRHLDANEATTAIDTAAATGKVTSIDDSVTTNIGATDEKHQILLRDQSKLRQNQANTIKLVAAGGLPEQDGTVPDMGVAITEILERHKGNPDASVDAIRDMFIGEGQDVGAGVEHPYNLAGQPEFLALDDTVNGPKYKQLGVFALQKNAMIGSTESIDSLRVMMQSGFMSPSLSNFVNDSAKAASQDPNTESTPGISNLERYSMVVNGLNSAYRDLYEMETGQQGSFFLDRMYDTIDRIETSKTGSPSFNGAIMRAESLIADANDRSGVSAVGSLRKFSYTDTSVESIFDDDRRKKMTGFKVEARAILKNQPNNKKIMKELAHSMGKTDSQRFAVESYFNSAYRGIYMEARAGGESKEDAASKAALAVGTFAKPLKLDNYKFQIRIDDLPGEFDFDPSGSIFDPLNIDIFGTDIGKPQISRDAGVSDESVSDVLNGILSSKGGEIFFPGSGGALLNSIGNAQPTIVGDRLEFRDELTGRTILRFGAGQTMVFDLEKFSNGEFVKDLEGAEVGSADWVKLVRSAVYFGSMSPHNVAAYLKWKAER
jgi:hypothetical protein